MGKAYANRKPKEERPESDFYVSPRSLIWALLDQTDVLTQYVQPEPIFDPCCGNFAIGNALRARDYVTDLPHEKGKAVIQEKDISIDGYDFLQDKKRGKSIILMNPPFSLFDEFITNAKETSKKVVSIGKLNFFGAYKRNASGLWKNLQHVYIFNRQVDYRTPERDDGLFHVGNLVTGWFLWNREWEEDYWETSMLDVQPYAKLGQFKEKEE